MSSEKRKGAVTTAEAEATAQNKMQLDYSMTPATSSTPLIVVEQLPVITERLRSVKDEVYKKTSQAQGLVCTEDNYKVIKGIRAALNKEFKALEDQRKQVKEQVMAPYKSFEDVYRECVSDAYKAADADLKAKIDEVENSIKAHKEDVFLAMFDELCEQYEIDPKYRKPGFYKIGMSDTEQNLYYMAEEKAVNIRAELMMIESQTYRDEILIEYEKGTSAQMAIIEVNNRHEALKKAAEEEAEKMLEENPWEDLLDTVTMTIRVRTTSKGAWRLTAFLNEHAYGYEVLK